MNRYIITPSKDLFSLRDTDTPGDLCMFKVGDYVKVKALAKKSYDAYIEEIVITKERTWFCIHDLIHGIRDKIPVDTIISMEVIDN